MFYYMLIIIAATHNRQNERYYVYGPADGIGHIDLALANVLTKPSYIRQDNSSQHNTLCET